MEVPVHRDGPRADPEVSRELHEWYALYRQFISRLDSRNRGYGDWTLSEFAEWWLALDPPSRAQCERDFRAGYDAILRAVREEIASAVKKYVPPADRPSPAAPT
jgi:hypothetical protein